MKNCMGNSTIHFPSLNSLMYTIMHACHNHCHRLRFQKDLQTQLLYNESQKQHFYTMTEEGERLAKELQKEKMKEKKEEDHKKAFMRKNYRDSNKMVRKN